MSIVDPLSAAPVEMRPLIRASAERLRTDFAGMFGEETIQRFMAEPWESLQGAKVAAFVPLFVERFTRQRLRALARVEGKSTDTRPMVVFLCVQNAGRSQMAAGWLQHLAGDEVEVFSGGSNPASEINPAAIEAMAEVGIDISSEFPKPWTDEVVRAAGRGRHDGVRRLLPDLPRQALHRLGGRRSGRAVHRARPTDPRRDR